MSTMRNNRKLKAFEPPTHLRVWQGNFIVGKRKELELNIPNTKVRRSDPLELRNRILSITASERKRLGINKSTLWYQKKMLAQRGNIHIYSKMSSILSKS